MKGAAEVVCPLFTDGLCIFLALGECFLTAFQHSVERRYGGFKVALIGNELIELTACFSYHIIMLLSAKIICLAFGFLYLVNITLQGFQRGADFVAQNITTIAGLNGDNFFVNLFLLTESVSTLLFYC